MTKWTQIILWDNHGNFALQAHGSREWKCSVIDDISQAELDVLETSLREQLSLIAVARAQVAIKHRERLARQRALIDSRLSCPLPLGDKRGVQFEARP